MLLTMLGDGRLHLTGIARLAPYLTPENRDALLKRATHRSKRQIEELIAEIAPRPDVAAVMRKLPERREKAQPTPALSRRPDGGAPSVELVPDRVTPPAPARPAVVQPLAPARYKVQFTASAQLHDKLERLRALMRSRVPDGDLAAVIEQVVTEKLQRLEARRFAKTSTPRRGLDGPWAPFRDRQPTHWHERAFHRLALTCGLQEAARCRRAHRRSGRSPGPT